MTVSEPASTRISAAISRRSRDSGRRRVRRRGERVRWQHPRGHVDQRERGEHQPQGAALGPGRPAAPRVALEPRRVLDLGSAGHRPARHVPPLAGGGRPVETGDPVAGHPLGGGAVEELLGGCAGDAVHPDLDVSVVGLGVADDLRTGSGSAHHQAAILPALGHRRGDGSAVPVQEGLAAWPGYPPSEQATFTQRQQRQLDQPGQDSITRSMSTSAERGSSGCRPEPTGPTPQAPVLAAAAGSDRQPFRLSSCAPGRPWHILYFLPEPHGQGALRAGSFGPGRGGAAGGPGLARGLRLAGLGRAGVRQRLLDPVGFQALGAQRRRGRLGTAVGWAPRRPAGSAAPRPAGPACGTRTPCRSSASAAAAPVGAGRRRRRYRIRPRPAPQRRLPSASAWTTCTCRL